MTTNLLKEYGYFSAYALFSRSAYAELAWELPSRLQASGPYDARFKIRYTVRDRSNPYFKNVLFLAKLPMIQGDREYKLEYNGIWSPQESDLTITLSKQNGEALIDFVAKRTGYSNIEYTLDIRRLGIRARFVSINEFRGINDFDVSVKIQVLNHEVEFSLDCTSPDVGAINVEARLTGSMGTGFNILTTYQHSNNGDIFELTLKDNECEVLKLKRALHDNGRMNSIALGCRDGINGRMDLFETLTTNESPYKVKITETWTGLDIDLNIDVEAKEGLLKVQNGVDSYELHAVVQTSNGKNFLVSFKKNDITEFLLDSHFELPMKGSIDIQVGSAFDLKAEITHDK